MYPASHHAELCKRLRPNGRLPSVAWKALHVLTSAGLSSSILCLSLFSNLTWLVVLRHILCCFCLHVFALTALSLPGKLLPIFKRVSLNVTSGSNSWQLSPSKLDLSWIWYPCLPSLPRFIDALHVSLSLSSPGYIIIIWLGYHSDNESLEAAMVSYSFLNVQNIAQCCHEKRFIKCLNICCWIKGLESMDFIRQVILKEGPSSLLRGDQNFDGGRTH